MARIKIQFLLRLFDLATAAAVRSDVDFQNRPLALADSGQKMLRHPMAALFCGIGLDTPLTFPIVGAEPVAGGAGTPGAFDPGMDSAVRAPHQFARHVRIDPLQERLISLLGVLPPSARTDLVGVAINTPEDPLTLGVVGPTAQAEVRRVEGERGGRRAMAWVGPHRRGTVWRGSCSQSFIRSVEEIVQLVEVWTVGGMASTRTLNHLGVRVVDYRQVDVEGADEDVMRSIDPDRFRLRLLCFESAFLSRQVHRAILEYRRGNGYEEFEGLSDTDTVGGLRGTAVSLG